MKKIFIAIAFVFMLSSLAYADGEPAYVLFGNVINISGGNDSVYVQTDDYSPEDKTTRSSVTVLESVWSTSPIMYGSIPSEKNALMNSGEPVDITTEGNKLSIVKWGGEGVYSMRLLDSNGNALIKDTLRTRQNTPIEIELSPEYRHYYIEFSQTGMNYDYDSYNEYFTPTNEPEFCYVLLRMRGTKSERNTSQPEKKEKKDSNAATEVIEDIYRRLRNKTGNDSVIHMDDTQTQPKKRDEAIRMSEHESHQELESHDNEREDEETNLIPARRVRIKRNTEYETESESELE